MAKKLSRATLVFNCGLQQTVMSRVTMNPQCEIGGGSEVVCPWIRRVRGHRRRWRTGPKATYFVKLVQPLVPSDVLRHKRRSHLSYLAFAPRMESVLDFCVVDYQSSSLENQTASATYKEPPEILIFE